MVRISFVNEPHPKEETVMIDVKLGRDKKKFLLYLTYDCFNYPVQHFVIKKSEDMSDEKSKSLDLLVDVNVKHWCDWS